MTIVHKRSRNFSESEVCYSYTYIERNSVLCNLLIVALKPPSDSHSATGFNGWTQDTNAKQQTKHTRNVVCLVFTEWMRRDAQDGRGNICANALSPLRPPCVSPGQGATIITALQHLQRAISSELLSHMPNFVRILAVKHRQEMHLGNNCSLRSLARGDHKTNAFGAVSLEQTVARMVF